MPVNSVLTGLPPSYNLRSDNNSSSAKAAALAKELSQKTTFAKAGTSQVTSAEVDGATQDAWDKSSDPGQFQSTFEQALRGDAATAWKSTSGTSDSPGGHPAPGIALYQRVSQYGNNDPSNSALLQSWNKIMQGGRDADSAAAAFAKLLSQNGMPGSESGVLDLTA
jgi:hypothetical protein